MVKTTDDDDNQERGTGMNAYARAAQNYSSMKVQSSAMDASPHRLIQMLFEGALERIAQAKGAMQQNQVARKGELIGKAINIVAGLQGSLSDKEGGQLSENLDDLYDYIIRALTEANYKNSLERLDECGRLLGELKSAWDGIADQAR
ncbi:MULTISPECIES: flagellar export chaperone FliS [unclassified Marinimicrobium]|jgi:flagellar protein FliS|uniref:flagellar export chaperone FliS n=2 Tax=Marinimicrobium TaxID=359337 RepID=UPI00257E99B1|nr:MULTISPECIES: flagellar export chaperone FliS [unclassified Marinimicrobium]|tara:strand:- start:330 stop:770 length:441 start_codon:yes stop_codon:yes gene_type:complete